MKNIDEVTSELRAAITQSAGKINEQVLQVIYENKLFKCLLPTYLGGLEYSLSHTLEVIRQCSQIDGSLAWLIQIGNGGTYFAPLYNGDITLKLFGHPKAVLAGSGHANGTAEPVSGGYVVNGTWHYCSGADYATFFTANCQSKGAVIACTFLREQVTIHQDWDAIGLKQTSTHTIRVKDAFVPDEYVFELGKRKSLHEVEALKLPFIAFAQLFFIAVQHGLFQAMIHAVNDLLIQQSEYWDTARKRAISEAIIYAENILIEDKCEVTNYVKMLESFATTEDDEQKIAEEIARQNSRLLQVAQHLFGLCGMRVLYNQHRLSKIYLDMLCVGQHQLLHVYH